MSGKRRYPFSPVMCADPGPFPYVWTLNTQTTAANACANKSIEGHCLNEIISSLLYDNTRVIKLRGALYSVSRVG